MFANLQWHSLQFRPRALIGGLACLVFAASAATGCHAEQPLVIETNDGVVANQPNVVEDDSVVDDFETPRELVFITTDRDAFGRLVGRTRVVQVPRPDAIDARPSTEPAPLPMVPQEGIVPIDGADADRDGYVEYYDNGHYVAELRKAPVVASQPRRLVYQGTVRAGETVALKNYTQPHLLLRVQQADGKHALVDVGVPQQFEDVAINNGDAIKVMARLGSIDGRPALIADEVIIDGESIRVVR